MLRNSLSDWEQDTWLFLFIASVVLAAAVLLGMLYDSIRDFMLDHGYWEGEQDDKRRSLDYDGGGIFTEVYNGERDGDGDGDSRDAVNISYQQRRELEALRMQALRQEEFTAQAALNNENRRTGGGGSGSDGAEERRLLL